MALPFLSDPVRCRYEGRRRMGETVAPPMKKLHLDTERIVYRLIFGEGMSALGAKAP